MLINGDRLLFLKRTVFIYGGTPKKRYLSPFLFCPLFYLFLNLIKEF